jgi:hypothetical protein
MTIQEEYDRGRRDFRDLDLKDADLTSAYLVSAELMGATFTRAFLRYADLTGANFTDTDLTGAQLEHSKLADADFTGAILTNTNLMGTRLTGTVLTDTCLDPEAIIPSLIDEEIMAAGLEMDGEWVYGWRTEQSQFVGSTKYVPREEPYIAHVFSVDQNTPCHPGIYLASHGWLDYHYKRRKPIVRCHCKRDELIHAGDKWRAKRLWIEE